MIGFELQLDPACTFADEAQAIEWSTRFAQRLSLALRCGYKLVLLNSFPLYADEQVDLRRDAEVSLLGVIDGGGFKKLGRWQNQSAEGTESCAETHTARRLGPGTWLLLRIDDSTKICFDPGGWPGVKQSRT
jgi:hypothetical protein